MIDVISKYLKFLRRFLFGALIVAILPATGIMGCSTGLESPLSIPSHVVTQREIRESKKPGNETSASEVSPISLQKLSIEEQRGQTTLHVRFSKPVSQYRHFPLTQPSRIILDVLGVAKPMMQAENFTIGTTLVGMLKFTPGGDSLRMAIDIAAATVPSYTVEHEEGGLRILIGSVDSRASAKRKENLVYEGRRVFAHAGPTQRKEYTEPAVSLIFENADIEHVFRFLGEVGGKNILVTEDVKKKITLNIKEPIPWDQALDLLIDTSGLGKEQVGNVIRISTLDQLIKDRNARAVAEKAKENEGTIQTTYFTVNYAKVKDLADKIQKIKSAAGIIVPDDQTNTILVRDIKRVIEEAKMIVGRFDIRTPQVLIESNLIETTPTFSRALGTEIDALFNGRVLASSRFLAGSPFAGSANTVAPPFPVPSTGFRFGYTPNNLNGFITAAENEGNAKIISRPSVVTLNNVPSTIKSERILRIALPSSTNIASGSGAAAGTAVATEKIPVGINLTVIPQVSSDGFVLMNIKVKSSSVANSSTVSGGTAGVVPFDELNREAEANVLVRDGETIVIGGILKDIDSTSTSGIPYLKNMPVLGWLFRNWRFQKDFEELVVLITPRIAAAGSENLPTAEQLWRDQMEKTRAEQPTAVTP